MAARLDNTLRLLPEPVKQTLKRVSGPADAVLRRSYRRRSGHRGPIPPARLRARVGAGVSVANFVEGGGAFLDEVQRLLDEQGRTIADFGTIYDWGCGCGRLVAHLVERTPPGTRVLGSDVDGEAVAWATRAFPRAGLQVNGFRPPLPAADGSVDLLIASSVFTHLTERDQDLWLQEVHRVLSPGGLAVISLAGFEMHWRMRDGHTATRSPELMGRLARMPELVDVGFHFEPYEIGGWNAADFAGIEDVYGLAFHMPEYVAAHWAPWLVELGRHYSVVNGWQDLVLFERAGQAPSSR